MRAFFVFIVLFYTNSLCAQDTLHATKVTLFDVNFSAGLFYHKSDPSIAEIARYTNHLEYLTEEFMEGYPKLEKKQGHRHSLGNSGGEINFNATFYLKSRNHLIRRIKPRLGYSSNNIVYLEFEGHYVTSSPVDTAYYDNPAYPPVIIDSVSFGSLTYEFTGQSSMVSIGANFDVLRHPRFICHTGLLFNLGKSTNTFLVSKTEQDDFSPENNLPIVYKSGGMLKKTEVELQESTSFISHVIIPVGWQHRFLPRRKFSHGIFVEFKPGLEFLKITKKPVIINPFLVISGGVKFNFTYNK